MRTAEGTAAPDLRRLPRLWIVALFAYGSIPIALSFPHLRSGSFVVATVVIVVASAVWAAVALISNEPRDISRPERRIAMLNSPASMVSSVAVLYLGIGMATLIERGLDAWFDIDVSWPRTAVQYGFLVILPTMLLGAYESDWKDELVDRPIGVPTSFAAFDKGDTGRRFVLSTVTMLVAVGLTLYFSTWWVSIAAMLLVLGLATAVTPQPENADGKSYITATSAALTALGYAIVAVSDPELEMGEASVINPIVQGVDLRAHRGDVDLAVAIHPGKDGVIVGWQEANRLLTAARSLSWSSTPGADDPNSDPPTVHPLLVLFDAASDDSLLGFADSEDVSVVQISTQGELPIVSAYIEDADLDKLAAALVSEMKGGGDGETGA